tara:strand:- start:525 stop:641 length:117 start_codon:yes stop_codon:yes gene_type:complete
MSVLVVLKAVVEAGLLVVSEVMVLPILVVMAAHSMVML